MLFSSGKRKRCKDEHDKEIDDGRQSGKITKILFAVFIMVISICVLYVKVPEMEYVNETIENLDESRDRIMTFSGSTLTASTAISLLPKDWANPLANSFVYIIPVACGLYILSVLLSKAKFKEWAIKFLILGLAIICVIPFSTHFTEKIGGDYLDYVDETIEETNIGAEKIYEVKSVNEEEDVFLDKISDIFPMALKRVV